MNVKAKANIKQISQTTQYTCCAASISAALLAHGKDVTEEQLNQVLQALPQAGASWESMLATVQYFGLRGTLVVPATVGMLKSWTDRGIPVIIAWNPENRPWSHASTVFDVTDDGQGGRLVHVMDPNVPNSSKTARIVGEDEFCQKWAEKVTDSLIMRRPAMAIEREVSSEGRQVVASFKKTSAIFTRVATRHIEAFQFALAQAFADQVGMPERMSLAQLTKWLNQMFLDWQSKFDVWELSTLEVGEMTSIDLEYGDLRGRSLEYPGDYSEGSFDVPANANGTYIIHVNIKDLAIELATMNTTTQFFKQHKREIFDFLSDHKNHVLLERFLLGVPLDAAVTKFEFNDHSFDALNEIFFDNADGLHGIVRSNQSVGKILAKFEGNKLVFSVDVLFTYDLKRSDIEVSPYDNW